MERRPASTLESAWIIASIVAVLLLAGCAGKRPVTSSPPPPPVSTGGQPSAPNPAPGGSAPSRPPPAPSATQPPTRATPFVPGVFVEQGTASWYGVPFHGRRAADGEIFDMNSLVAAHRTLPFGSILRVTNLNNGREVQVRVIDRGPFVANRVLDLARAAAEALGMIGTGTAPVRIELLSGPNPETGEFTVQVGAFTDRGNAERLRDRLLGRYPLTFIQDYEAPTGHFYRVHVGREPSPETAQQLAAELKSSENFQTFVVRVDPTPDVGLP